MPENIESLLLKQRYWDIFSVPRNSSIEDACKIMDKNRIGALLVYCSDTNDPQDLEGIVTERDLLLSLSPLQLLHAFEEIYFSYSSFIHVYPGFWRPSRNSNK